MRFVLAVLAFASVGLLAVQLVPVPFGETVFSVLAFAFPTALCALGGRRLTGGRKNEPGDKVPRLGIGLVTLGVVLESSALGMLLLRGRIETAPWLAGIPLAAWVQWLGLGMAPLVLVGALYAWTFEHEVLDQKSLEQLRLRFGRKNEPGATEGQPS